MPKATFTKDFVWKAKQNVRLVYKAGKTYGVTTACMAGAVAAGAVARDSVVMVERKYGMSVGISAGVTDARR